MFDATVDGLGGAIAGAEPVEVGQDVVGAFLQRPAGVITSRDQGG